MKSAMAAIFGLLFGVIGGHFLWHGGNEAQDSRDGRSTVACGVSATDRVAIDKLHQEDIDVTLTQDPKGILDVWDEDGVRIRPDGAAVVGKKAIEVDNAKFRAAYPEFKVVKYAPDVEHFVLAVADGWAVEVGTTAAVFKMTGKDEPTNVQDKGMRLLKRQADGSWKFAMVGMK
jgi:hypothetical protein